ncbi:MAG: adenosylcobalamin-dependent ribonucleoside-diphosphate reductase [Candidatus Aenigmatarchaeota archaeon]
MNELHDIKLSANALTVLEQRYLLRNDEGKVVESPLGMFRRVARAVASANKKYNDDPKLSENEFYQMMAKLEFLPNSPTLMNAGTSIGQLSACFVLPLEDSLDKIFKTIHDAAIIQKSGGGTGFSFSSLRPKGDPVKTTMGIASGPVSYMRVFNAATETIKQGSKRRGANMGILHVSHPDIIEFISCKSDLKQMNNFNISVAIDDKFMRSVKKDQEYPLINPRTNQIVRKVRAHDIWNLIITMAWKTGDPGIIFIDEINRKNQLPNIDTIESTNPCGEMPLLPYESCNLGSINLSKFIKNDRLSRKPDIDWIKLKKTIHLAVRFLDNIIDINKYPMPEIEKITKANRKIGLGIMGFANMLTQLRISYDSKNAVELAENLMKFIKYEATNASEELGKRRGSFPNIKSSVWFKKCKAMRNSTVTTIASTGTLSIIANCSSGIEPLFAISYIRNILDGRKLVETDHYFEQTAKEKKFFNHTIMAKIAKSDSIQPIKEIPADVRKIFKTAHDVSPEQHVRMQAAFQKYTDNAVSKTINLPKTSSIKDIEKAFMLAYKLKCKGITAYRYGSKPNQVFSIADQTKNKTATAESDFSGDCPFPMCSGV